jgi:hypothetical protein
MALVSHERVFHDVSWCSRTRTLLDLGGIKREIGAYGQFSVLSDSMHVIKSSIVAWSS